MLIIAAVNIQRFPLLLGLTAAPLLLLARDIKIVLPRLIPANLFCALLCITVPLGGGGFATVLCYTLRINAAALLGMLFIIPLGISGLASSLSALKTPPKLVSLLILTYRYLFVMYERVFASLLSIRLRRPCQTTGMGWRSYAAVFAAALAGALFRSRKVWLAMESRGFDGVFPITRSFAWKAGDTAALAACLAASIGLLLMDKGLFWNI
jgi:cobalt/nickel transport system permease protein